SIPPRELCWSENDARNAESSEARRVGAPAPPIARVRPAGHRTTRAARTRGMRGRDDGPGAPECAVESLRERVGGRVLFADRAGPLAGRALHPFRAAGSGHGDATHAVP